jgi:hypothetical protein
MDRVGGAYKRKTQLCGFIIGSVIAAGLNVNAINIGKTLSRQPMLVKQIATQKDLGSMDVGRTLATLEALDLPIGWGSEEVKNPNLELSTPPQSLCRLADCRGGDFVWSTLLVRRAPTNY